MYERRAKIHEILADASGEKVSIAFLSASVGACRRTIFYDLDALTLNHNIETYPGRGGGVRLVLEKFPCKCNLSDGDQSAILEAIIIVDKPLAERLGKIITIHCTYCNKKRLVEALKGKAG